MMWALCLIGAPGLFSGGLLFGLAIKRTDDQAIDQAYDDGFTAGKAWGVVQSRRLITSKINERKAR